MSSDVWIGAVISIPVSIGVALAVPHIQDWLNQRGKTSHLKKLDRMRDEYETVLDYALHTDHLLGRMLVTVITLLLLIIVGLVAGTTVPTLGDAMFEALHIGLPTLVNHRTLAIAISTSMLLAFGTALIIQVIKMSSRYVKLFFNVRNFTSYVESIPIELRDKDREKLVAWASYLRAVPREAWVGYRAEIEMTKSTPQTNSETSPPASSG